VDVIMQPHHKPSDGAWPGRFNFGIFGNPRSARSSHAMITLAQFGNGAY